MPEPEDPGPSARRTLFALVLSLIVFSFPSYSFAQAQLPTLSQLVNLSGSSNTGIIDNFSVITANGNTTPYSIPAGMAIVLKLINFNYTPNSAYTGGVLSLAFEPYWASYFTASSVYIVSDFNNLNSGFAISDNIKLKVKIITNNGQICPGKFEVRLLGYHTSLTSSTNEPINTFLLSRK